MNAIEIPATDTGYEDSTIKSVRHDGDGWSIEKADGWSIFVEATDPPPKVGDRIRCYMVNVTAIRGIVINGRAVRYQTEEEYRREQQEWQAAAKQKRVAEAEACKEETARRIAALPEVMQRRLAGFRARKADFDSEYMPYELMCCEQAVAIAHGCKTLEGVGAFREMTLDRQREIVPEMSGEHSGNSMGFSCRLACWLLMEPENVVKEHGALCALVGCKDYGCQYGERA